MGDGWVGNIGAYGGWLRVVNRWNSMHGWVDEVDGWVRWMGGRGGWVGEVSGWVSGWVCVSWKGGEDGEVIVGGVFFSLQSS